MTVYPVPDLDPWLIPLIEALPGAAIIAKPEWGSQTFQVAGKHFGRVGDGPSGNTLLTLKGDPQENAAMVAQYAAVIPGHYADKRLWISIDLDECDVPRPVIAESIATSYALVVAKLPRAVRESLA
jgi:predicted DNA-binding protein (MmcQ/YjbR family)